MPRPLKRIPVLIADRLEPSSAEVITMKLNPSCNSARYAGPPLHNGSLSRLAAVSAEVMIREDQIRRDVRLRALVAFGDIPAGSEAIVHQVREATERVEWRFSVRWLVFRKRGRSPYSLFFTAEDLPHFELVDQPGSERWIPDPLT